MKQLYKKLLPKLGLCSTIPKVYRHGSHRYGGTGLPILCVVHIIAKINFLLIHYQSNSLAKQHLHTSMEGVPLEVVTDVPFTECSYKQYGNLATDCWLILLWCTVSILPLTLTIHQHPHISMQRIDDILFMPHVIKMNKFTGKKYSPLIG